MKKIFTSFFAAMLAVAASAQVTASISPSDKNVFTPSEYEYLTVVYGDTVDVTTAVAKVSCGTASTTLEPDSTSTLQAFFDITKVVSTLGITDGSIVSVSVSGVSGADSVSASYKYYATVPTPTASVESGSTLESKATDVTFTFSSPMICQSIDYASGNQYNIVERDSVLTSSLTASILESYWDSSSASITVSLDGLKDADGYSYPIYEATYYIVETVNYLGVTADPATYTYQQVYDELWTVGFKFDKEVVMPEEESPALVTFIKNGDLLDVIEVEDYDISVNPISGTTNYVVEVLIPEVPSTASDYTEAIIELQGFTYGGNLIDQPSVTYYATLSSSAKASKKGSVAGIQNTVKKLDNRSVVYNLQGVQVKSKTSHSELKNLAKGIYIIGGKKIVIK